MGHGKFCEQGPTVCVDKDDPCRIGECIEGSGCVNYQQVQCPDSTVPCMEYTCDRRGGCILVPVVCDNGDPCSAGICNPLTGSCEFAPKVCDDSGDPCIVATCIAGHGCVAAPKSAMTITHVLRIIASRWVEDASSNLTLMQVVYHVRSTTIVTMV